METDKNKLCRLCLKTLRKNNCEEIGEITKEILNVLLLTPDLSVTEENAICNSCVENLQNSFNFKATCFYTEDCIVPFLKSNSTAKLDLRELYMDQNKKLNAINISADEKICRLCLTVETNEYFIHLDDVKNLLVKCIPELDFNSTREPVICTDCLKSLKDYFRFLENCLSTEKRIRKYCYFKRKRNSQIKLIRVVEFTQKESSDGSLSMVKNEENCLSAKGDIKSNNSETNTTLGIILQRSENLGNDENQIGSLTHANNESTELKLYKCGSCSFQTKYRGNFKKHEMLHKDPSEIQWFKCALCPYKEKLKRYLISHLETHKKEEKLKQSEMFVKKRNVTNTDSVNLKLYECGNCSFRTKHSSSLKNHERLHKDPSEIEWFKCALCSYKTITKYHLIGHSKTHKMEKTIFKCDKCMYKSKWKANLKNHAQIHEDPATLKMYCCEVCSFKTRRHTDLTGHMRKHVNKKEVKCEICPFKTKYKESLRRHMIKHKNPSELKKYKCESCAYETVWKTLLSKHVLYRHTDKSKLEKLKCEKCNYITPFKVDFNRHIQGQRHKKRNRE